MHERRRRIDLIADLSLLATGVVLHHDGAGWFGALCILVALVNLLSYARS